MSEAPGWKRVVGMGGVLPQEIENGRYLAGIRGEQQGRPAFHQLYLNEEADEFYIYQYVWADEIQSNIGQLRGPLTAEQVQETHPEFNLVIHDEETEYRKKEGNANPR